MDYLREVAAENKQEEKTSSNKETTFLIETIEENKK
jgi:hypothetical protein